MEIFSALVLPGAGRIKYSRKEGTNYVIVFMPESTKPRLGSPEVAG
jgi:hypothetical protein